MDGLTKEIKVRKREGMRKAKSVVYSNKTQTRRIWMDSLQER